MKVKLICGLKKIIVLFLVVPCVFADDKSEDTSLLEAVTENYAVCADVALGNFDSDEEGQQAIKKLYKAMIVNIRKMISLELIGSKSMQFFQDVLGNEGLVGYMLRGVSEFDEYYQLEKQNLRHALNYDFRQTHKQLWSKHGCDAIYASL